ncbi:hypothetical protein I6F36_06445 [Bradyrhizobium sp. BRP19]|uniref:hypothetical protein n=1 Tax=Bradyrhizobium sp. BRP19 TaxID=2793823 RepID=UPI001CD7021E|nr:hypothetical protein [Bradyrhizobium sp. BRP19]MCA1546444.1 hypothetical protein [Bradyrhizobium sp. BRP19]
MIFLTRNHQRRNLVLPDGRIAEDLRLLPLQAELTRLQIPGISAELGKQDLLDRYAAHVAEVVKALPKQSHVGKTPKTIAELVARQAAELIGRQAASPLAIENQAAPRPQPPHISVGV